MTETYHPPEYDEAERMYSELEHGPWPVPQWANGSGGPADDAPEAPENPIQQRLAELRHALVDSAGLDAITEPTPLIDGILFMDSLAWLYGKPGSAKSFVALDWAGSVGTGRSWFSRHAAQGSVLYLVAEGASGIPRRVRAWEEAAGIPMKNVTFLPVAVQLLNAIDRQALMLLVAEQRPTLVVIDTQARVTVGADENSNGEMGKVVHVADAIRQAAGGACVLLVHHSGKNGLDMRGASAFEGAATSIIKITREREYVEVHSDKQKDVENFETLRLRMVPIGQSIVLEDRNTGSGAYEASKNEALILTAMHECFETTSASANSLVEASGVPRASVYRALNTLVRRGLLVNIGTEKRALYALPKDIQPTP